MFQSIRHSSIIWPSLIASSWFWVEFPYLHGYHFDYVVNFALLKPAVMSMSRIFHLLPEMHAYFHWVDFWVLDHFHPIGSCSDWMWPQCLEHALLSDTHFSCPLAEALSSPCSHPGVHLLSIHPGVCCILGSARKWLTLGATPPLWVASPRPHTNVFPVMAVWCLPTWKLPSFSILASWDGWSRSLSLTLHEISNMVTTFLDKWT